MQNWFEPEFLLGGKKTLFYFNETFSSTNFFITAQAHLEMVESKQNVYFAISRQFLNVKTEYISITGHTFKQVNNSVWVTAFVVFAPVPHVHRLLNYQGIWSTSSLFVPTHFRASVIHPATTNVITLHLFVFSCGWEICFHIRPIMGYTVWELLSTEQWQVIW